jgi:hypothetical protein
MFDDDSVVWLRERKKGFEGFGIFCFPLFWLWLLIFWL